MKHRLLFFSLTSALAGFLFGFDTVVISGAEQTIQAYWHLSPQIHGLAMASALYGTVIGALCGGWPTDHFGRKRTLFVIGIFYLVSALGAALAPHVVPFSIARFIGGLGIGASTIAAPLYISEISPPERRGRLTALFQLNVVIGMLIAYISNALLAHLGEGSWRWMLGVQTIPALIYTLMTLAIPESPRWLLIYKRNRPAALKVLREVNPLGSDENLQTLADEIEASAPHGEVRSRFWSRKLRIPILLAFFVAFFNQFSGINAVLYFAPRIFVLSGLGEQAALLQSVGVGVAFAISTMLGVWLIDRIGRRALLYIGGWGYVFSLGLCAWAFYTEHFAIVPYCIFAFIAAHGIGQGTVIWVLIAEVFPNRQRGHGQSFGSFTHWTLAAIITTFFPVVVGVFHPGSIFLFFCLMMVLQLFWLKLMVPETKGVPLEELQRRLGTEGA